MRRRHSVGTDDGDAHTYDWHMPTENNTNSLRVDPDTLLKWFDEKWKDHECPICHGHSWRVESTGFRLDRFAIRNQDPNGVPFLILIPVICKNCAYTALFDNTAIEAVKLYAEAADE